LPARIPASPRPWCGRKWPARELLNTLLLSPLVVPAIVIGQPRLYLFFVDVEDRHRVAPYRGGWPGLGLGHILISIPWTVRLIAANLVGIDRTHPRRRR